MSVGRVVVALLVVGAVGAITVLGVKERPPPAVEVQTGQVKRASIARVVAGAGKVQPATTVKISSNLSGDLVELSVKEGDQVTKGQVLGRLDRRRYEANAKQANAAANAAKSDVATGAVDVSRLEREAERVRGLVEKGLASAAEQDKAQSELASAKARVAALSDRAAQAAAVLEEAQNNLSKTVMVSPIDGTVIELTREVGERVRGSDFNEDVVMTLAALAAMEVKIEVGEHEVVHLKPGQKAWVTIDALEGQSFEGSLVEIAQKALVRNPGSEQETTSFPITVALSVRPAGVMPGMSAEVRVTAEQREGVLVVPVQAVTVRPASSLPDAPTTVEGAPLTAKKAEAFAKVVFVVDGEQKARARRVRTGIASDTDIEVLEGLNEGDAIVEGPYRTLSKEIKEGDRVEAVKPGQGKKRGPKRG